MENRDFGFALSLARTMQWNMTAADYEFNMQLEPKGCFVVVDGSQPVGLATCINYGKVGWFGNLVVKDTYRKMGIGTQLVRYALNYLKMAGAKTIGLYSYPQLEEFYGEVGFKPDRDFLVLKAEAVSSLPTDYKTVRQTEPKDLSAIVDFDRMCFGAKRKRILENILKNPCNVSYVAEENSEIVGFVAAKVYGKAAEIGPLNCKREKPEVTRKVLSTILGRIDGFEAYIYVGADERALINDMFKAGFKEDYRLRRMFFGPTVATKCLYSAESLERG